MAAGVVAVVITALSITAGKYATVELMMPSDEELVEMLMADFDDEVVISFLADEVVAEQLRAGSSVEWPDGVDPSNASGAADYPPSVWAEASQRWEDMGEADRTAFREAREDESRTYVEANLSEIRALISRGGFFASFSPMDLLFFGLAIATAWGIGSGRKSQEKVEAAYRGAVMFSMLRVAAANDVIEDAEVETIRSLCVEIFGTHVEAAAVRAEAETLEEHSDGLLKDLSDLSPHLDMAQRERLVRAVLEVALADGSVNADEQLLIEEIAAAVGVSDKHLAGILSHLASTV